MPRKVVLVGAGHAHIEVIRSFGERPIADTHLSVVEPNPRPVYSGMVPGFIAGQYERSELEIDLKALCDASRVHFEPLAASRIHAPEQRIELSDGRQLSYDFASLDVGSSVAGLALPGVRDFALPSRPIAQLLSRVDALIDPGGDAPFHVIGGGAGGVEVAFCLDARLARRGSEHPPVVIVTSDTQVLSGSSNALRGRVARALARRNIRTLCNSPIGVVFERGIGLEDGSRLDSSGAVWVTGAAAHALAADSGLPVDARGFVRIGPTLEVEGLPELFAVGDCASLAGMKKAGVYAVRSGPLLDSNLRARLAGQPLQKYQPQGDFLSLLNLGDGRAIGAKWGVAFEGRAVMWLKDRIDRAFMAKYAA